jgi:hypothetical protein
MSAIEQPATVARSRCVDQVPIAPVGAPAISTDAMVVSPPPMTGYAG